ncbi:MAG: efflux system, outer rane lipoprotein CmeC [Rickettsiaceae bacterium]|nr:efflux system, outer rane lipoprotein CmeC [Rickettsiaceae bacterium]
MKKLLLASTILLNACNLTPPYSRPVPTVPEKWSDANIATQGENQNTTPFWEQINDKELQFIIATSLKQNLDIESALQRIEQARAEAKIAGANLVPTADASFGANRSFDKSSGGDYSQSSSLWGGLALNYEVDLWQRNRAGAKAAAFRVESSHFDHDAVTISTVSDIIINYAQLITLQKRIEVAKKALENAQAILKIIETRFAEGSNSSLEVAQQKTSIYGFRATITSLERQYSASRNALAILNGAAPQQFVVKHENNKLPELPAPSLTPPSSLLTNRPDIRSAEAGLMANNADIGAARAAFYPSITLGVNAAAVASSFSNPAATALELSSSILAPIFSGGRLRGNLEKITARQKELAAQYQKIILVSFQETENALSSLKAARLQNKTYTSANIEANKAYRIAKERFDSGSIDFLNLLDSQRTLLQAEDNMVQGNFDEFSATIQLYKAMGWIPPE